MGLPKYAEHSFAAACSFADAIPHRPDDDQNGWDYMVEFDQEPRSGHSDMHAAASKAFVQIKSTVGKPLSCTVKLSNALKSAQSKLPWFLVLYVAEGTPRKPAIYAKHIWQRELERTLREVRAAEKLGVLLSKKRLRITFDNSDRKSEDELVSWMEECIDNVKPDYSQRKAELYNTVGFEGGYAVGHLNLIADDEDTLFSNFLGLGSGLQATKFTLTPTRFGIEDNEPAFSFENAIVHITPSSASECEIRFRGPSAENMISIPAKVYVLGEPIVTPERRRLRFSGTGVEIIWPLDGNAKFEFKFNYDERQSLPALEKLATIMKWGGIGPIDLQVWRAPVGGKALAAKLNLDQSQARRLDWEKIADICKTLRTLAGTTSEHSLLMSIAEMNRSSSDLYFMHQIITAPSLMMEFFPLIDLPPTADRVLYYSSSEVGELTAYALIERPVRVMRDLDHGRKSLEFGEPGLQQSWIVRNATEQHRAMITDDYLEQIKQMRTVGQSPLELGDIGQVYKQGLLDRERTPNS